MSNQQKNQAPKQKNKINGYMAIFLGFMIVTMVAFVATRAEFGAKKNLVTAGDTSKPKPAEEKVMSVSKELSAAQIKILNDTSADNYLGKEYAPVVLIEYGSLTCSHCKHFHETVVEQLIPTYIESGKVKYIYRDFLRNKQDLTAAKITHCVDKDKYFGFVKAFFKAQDNWAFTPKFEEVLGSISKLGGISPEKFASCQANKETEDKLLKIVKDAQDILEVRATPAIFINGHLYEGDRDYAHVSAFIDKMLKGE